ncbi:MAG: hypothetical protein R3B13_17565 [Polyangiaceae bacterium]
MMDARNTLRPTRFLLVVLGLLCNACGDGETDAVEPKLAGCPHRAGAPGSCGGSAEEWTPLVEFPAGVHDAARVYDRQFHALSAYATGVNADVRVDLANAEQRQAIATFLTQSEGWDFEASSGRSPETTLDAFGAAAGLYAGVGIAADAFRYATLRDEGQSCAEVARAREHLQRGMRALILASEITGEPGVIARGFARKDLPGDGQSATTPLFDSDGNPLPAEKDNGTWREDNSGGKYPDYIWVDSCSRDMYVGWALALAAVWEVTEADASIDDELKKSLRRQATAMARSLMQVGEEGYDLEIRDADGRRTFHGVLNENAIDRFYLAGASNGMYGMMSLGIVAALAFVSREPDIDRYLNDQLIGERQLHELARDNLVGVDLDVKSNYSSYNMAFMGALLAGRYLCNEDARGALAIAVRDALYARPGRSRQPSEQGQSLYDFVFAHAVLDLSALQRSAAPLGDDVAPAVARGVASLEEFRAPPSWDEPRLNCDEAEITAGVCIAEDGTQLTLLGYVGRGDKLVSKEPVPMRTRPASNYHWRSNPYEVNGDSTGTTLLPGVDFRIAYWLGRWARR